MEFKKQLFIFSYFKLKDINNILSENQFEEIDLRSKHYYQVDNYDLSNVMSVHTNFSEFGLMNNGFGYVIIIPNYTPAIYSAIKLAKFDALVIDIKSPDLSDCLVQITYDLSGGYELYSSINIASSKSVYVMDYQSKRIDSLIKSSYQHLEDAGNNLCDVAKEIYRVYKKNYHVYSNLSLGRHYG
jgi:hypothetical protein